MVEMRERTTEPTIRQTEPRTRRRRSKLIKRIELDDMSIQHTYTKYLLSINPLKQLDSETVLW